MFDILLEIVFAPFSVDWFRNELVLIPAGVLFFCSGFSLIRMLINLAWRR